MALVPIETIDVLDERFRISYPLEDENLLSSIANVGIVQPVLLFGNRPFTLVTGFRRLNAALKLGRTEVPALRIETDEKDALLRAIHDNLFRTLNLVEKSHVLDKMYRHGFSKREILEMAGRLGTGAHEETLKTLLGLANGEDSLKQFVASRMTAVKAVKYLLNLDEGERLAIVALFSSFHTTESTMREALQLLNLLKIGSGELPLDQLEATNVHEFVNRLKTLVYPFLTRLNNRLRALKETSALPPGTDIKVDPFFEKEYIDIHIRGSRKEDIERSIQKLIRLLEDGTIGSILDLTHGKVR